MARADPSRHVTVHPVPNKLVTHQVLCGMNTGVRKTKEQVEHLVFKGRGDNQLWQTIECITQQAWRICREIHITESESRDGCAVDMDIS